MKLLEIAWNCNLSLMTFLNNLPVVLSKTIDWKVLGESYDFLLDLRMIMNIETLKFNGQWSNSMHALAITINFLRHVTSLIHFLKCLYNSLLDSRVDELLNFAMVLVSSTSSLGYLKFLQVSPRQFDDFKLH